MSTVPCLFQHLSRSSILSCQLLLLGGKLGLFIGCQVQEGVVFTRLDVAVVGTDNAVSIIDSDGPDVSQSLDLEGALLVVVVGHLDVELLSTRLDGVPACQTRGKVDVSRHAKVFGIDDLVGAGVVEDGLGVDTGLVGESTETGDVVVERNVDLDGLGNEVLNVLELLQPVLALDVVAVGNHHTGHQTTKRGDTVTLTNTQDRGIDVGGTSLQSAVGIGNGTSSVVVEVSLNITTDNSSQDTNQLVDLARRGTADSVSNTNTVDTNLVDGGVDGQEINQVGTERVLTGETDLNALGLDKLDDFDGGVLDVGHVLAVRVLTEVGRSTNDNVTRKCQNPKTRLNAENIYDLHSVNTGLDGDSSIIHMTPDVGEDLHKQLVTILFYYQRKTRDIPWTSNRACR